MQDGESARRLLSFFFDLLYTRLAFAYDLVAWVVSFGRWYQWTSSLQPHIKLQPVLELGFGTGHLHRELAEDGHRLIGIDRSRQMTRITRNRLLAANLVPVLMQADGSHLPLAACSLGTIAATFPAEYIFTPAFEQEVHRVLKPGGQFVILPYVSFSKNGWPARLLGWIYRITGTSPAPDLDLPGSLHTSGRYRGFEIEVREEITPLATLPILVLTKA
jgi:ubiquinone/menaquinone biosynthesis C-methylase UbiE